MARSVEESMPPKTTVPRARWLADPAPKDTRRGTTPRMKANEVITMGRNRLAGGFDRRLLDGHAAFVQVAGEFHDEDGVLACQGDHEDESDLGIEIAVVSADYESKQDPTSATGTTRMTAPGELQLSYRAASTI